MHSFINLFVSVTSQNGYILQKRHPCQKTLCFVKKIRFFAVKRQEVANMYLETWFQYVLYKPPSILFCNSQILRVMGIFRKNEKIQYWADYFRFEFFFDAK